MVKQEENYWETRIMRFRIFVMKTNLLIFDYLQVSQCQSWAVEIEVSRNFYRFASVPHPHFIKNFPIQKFSLRHCSKIIHLCTEKRKIFSQIHKEKGKHQNYVSYIFYTCCFKKFFYTFVKPVNKTKQKGIYAFWISSHKS